VKVTVAFWIGLHPASRTCTLTGSLKPGSHVAAKMQGTKIIMSRNKFLYITIEDYSG
jgi:hypothetical protein